MAVIKSVYKGYRKDAVTVEDYTEWRNSSPVPACQDSPNLAFISSFEEPSQIRSALAQCEGCPLLDGCNFFAHTRVFKNIEGVMGGEFFVDGRANKNLPKKKRLRRNSHSQSVLS